jgi:hypothetical protein
MTRDEIMNMPAGREMDALIAEKIFKLEGVNYYGRPNLGPWVIVEQDDATGLYCWVGDGSDFDEHRIYSVPLYSKDIESAWAVAAKGSSFGVDNYSTISQEEAADGIVRWTSEIYIDRWGEADADTAPLAICRAALLAVMT